MLSTKHLIRSCVFGLASLALLQACSKNGDDVTTTQVADTAQVQTLAQVERTADGVVLTLANSTTKKVRLQVMTENIIRVTALPGDNFSVIPASIQVVAQPNGGVDFTTEQQANNLVLKTAQLSAEVSLVDGTVTFRDVQGKVVLAEENRGTFSPVIGDPGAVDADSFAIRQEFNRNTDEGFFGLGQHQNGQVNYAGENVELTTYNLVISIPYVVSSRNYGVLWDNNSITRFGNPLEAHPLNAALTLYDAEGKKGGLTVRYYVGDELVLTRVEADFDHQFLSQGSNLENPFPTEVADAYKNNTLRVELEGSIEANTTGKHQFKMYSSGYAKLALDGETVLDRWRMNWNPWYHTYYLDMDAGQKKSLRVDWKPNGGYFHLRHLDPLPQEERNQLSLASETGKAIDYYFVLGENKDEVIAGYRHLTGKSVMLPKWAYGFWQSRERYKSSDEIISNLKEYRDRKIPIDNIVLDWSYWPEDAWGSHDFDKKFFPDPKALVDQVHGMNAQIMISVWPKFYPTTENYKELNAKGFMFNRNIEENNLDWIGKGYLNAFYDPFAQEAREIFWRQIKEKINVHGFDAWWLDAVEPDIHSNLSFTKRKELMTPNTLGTGAEIFNAYAVPHAEGVYHGERMTDGHQRAFILTRSGFGGIQRTGSAIWSGDIVSRWSDLKEQIAAGVGVGLAGVANWTFDIGGFTPEDRFRSSQKGFVGPWKDLDKEQVEEWQELNTRWYQFGAFAPLYRSHGQNPYREIFNIADQGSESYESMVWYTKLRYRLMPYIYTLAGDTFHKDGTIMRGLVMDFPDDKKAWDINTQYMFGPAFLVNPVVEFKARQREVYLPAGTTWYDFYSGDKHEGGQTIEAAAPYSRMPLFVKAGSIVPTGPAIQYTDEGLNAPLTLNVYTGADGAFEIYEDDGRSYDYEKGQWSRIPVTYNDATGELTIGERIGGFEGMAEQRSISVRWISGPAKDAADFDAKPAHTLEYVGKSMVVKRAP
jgi:alpha-D-xyloside xylohydrolase